MQNVRMLIAHDNPHILQFLSDFFSDDLCSVGTVSDRKSLTAVAMALHPHIIVTGRPTKASLDAVHQLEALLPDMKVMALTEHEEVDIAAAVREADAPAALTKDAPDLCGKIRAIIREFLPAQPKWIMESTRAYGNDHASIGSGVD